MKGDECLLGSHTLAEVSERDFAGGLGQVQKETGSSGGDFNLALNNHEI